MYICLMLNKTLSISYGPAWVVMLIMSVMLEIPMFMHNFTLTLFYCNLHYSKPHYTNQPARFIQSD